jgi:hypothetical protein
VSHPNRQRDPPPYFAFLEPAGLRRIPSAVVAEKKFQTPAESFVVAKEEPQTVAAEAVENPAASLVVEGIHFQPPASVVVAAEPMK